MGRLPQPDRLQADDQTHNTLIQISMDVAKNYRS
jgi:hypothetical protein